MQLARYYLERLTVGAKYFTEGKKFDSSKVTRKFVEFVELPVKFPASIPDFKDIDDAKSLFRLANTQFKRALDYFVLDGYVTEHVQMKQDLSKLYK